MTWTGLGGRIHWTNSVSMPESTQPGVTALTLTPRGPRTLGSPMPGTTLIREGLDDQLHAPVGGRRAQFLLPHWPMPSP
jgi:hypothetical protein